MASTQSTGRHRKSPITPDIFAVLTKHRDFNFAIPELPYISGRELAGEVVKKPRATSRLKTKDRVLVISTDYRDLRKAAYQEYVVAFDYNTVRLPPTLSAEEGSTLGVAFVAATLALGVCMGVDFSSVLDGPDLYSLVREISPESLASDIRDECLEGIADHERARAGDWLAVWGGTCGSPFSSLCSLPFFYFLFQRFEIFEIFEVFQFFHLFRFFHF